MLFSAKNHQCKLETIIAWNDSNNCQFSTPQKDCKKLPRRCKKLLQMAERLAFSTITCGLKPLAPSQHTIILRGLRGTISPPQPLRTSDRGSFSRLASRVLFRQLWSNYLAGASGVQLFPFSLRIKNDQFQSNQFVTISVLLLSFEIDHFDLIYLKLTISI